MDLFNLSQNREVRAGPLDHKHSRIGPTKDHILIPHSLQVRDSHGVDDIVRQDQVTNVVDVFVKSDGEQFGHSFGELELGRASAEEDVVVDGRLHAEHGPVWS